MLNTAKIVPINRRQHAAIEHSSLAGAVYILTTMHWPSLLKHNDPTVIDILHGCVMLSGPYGFEVYEELVFLMDLAHQIIGYEINEASNNESKQIDQA